MDAMTDAILDRARELLADPSQALSVRWVCTALLAADERARALAEAAREIVDAAIAYDDAIRSCANDPEKMTEFGTAQGDDLDSLYMRWMTLVREFRARGQAKADAAGSGE